MASDPRDKLLESTADALNAFMGGMRNRMRWDGDRPRLGPLAGMLLHLLDRVPEPTPSALAEAMQVTPATITGALNKLEAEGLVHRERSPQDRRVVLVRRTEKGAHMFERHRAAWRGMSRQALGGLTNAQLRQLKELLDVARTSQADGPAGPH